MTPGAFISWMREAELRRHVDDANDTMGDVPSPENRPYSVRVPGDLRARFTEALEVAGESVSDVLRESIEGYIALHADPTYREAVALAEARGDRLEDVFHEFLRDYIVRHSLTGDADS
jgi:hypothetical protein